mgnify:CR=1 FL=1
MDRRSFLLSSSALAAAALPWRGASAAAAPWRTFEVVSRVEVVRPQGVSRAWVPLPLAEATEWQRPLGNTWGGNAARALAMTEDKYGVRMVYAEWRGEASPSLEVVSRFATRDRAVDLSAPAGSATLSAAEQRFYTAPTELIPTDGIVRKTALEITQGARGDLAKARAIYDWVVDNTFRDPTKAEKTGKHIRTVADILKVLNASLAATDAQYKLFGGTTDNLAQEKLKALNKAFDDLVKIGLKPTSPELKKVADQINLISASIIGVEPLTTVLAQKLGKQVKITKVKPLTPEQLAELTGIKEESQLFLKPKINIEPIYQTTPALENLDKFSKLFTAKMAKMAKDAKDAFNKNYIVWGNALTSGLTPAIVNLGELMRNGLNNAFSAVGESLGKAITGGGLSDVLSGIISTMSDFIIAFGRQLVEAGTLALIAQRYIIANPALAIAAGVAAIALGSALKNAVPAFATGGTVNGPTLAMVGDNPSGVEHIIPQEVLDRLGGSNDGFIAEARVSGTDLLVLVKQAERNQGR